MKIESIITGREEADLRAFKNNQLEAEIRRLRKALAGVMPLARIGYKIERERYAKMHGFEERSLDALIGISRLDLVMDSAREASGGMRHDDE